jgi:polysaccharide chain length determinant protein (PEP-CTERM system associated)
MQQSTAIHPRDVLRLILKYRWYVIIPFCLSMMTGIFLALTLPRMYQSETLILVQPQKVPSSYVQSIVTSDIDSRISSISQQILSRTNLEKIIDEFKLFPGAQYEKMYMEDKIESLRRRIKVNVTRDKRRDADAFRISFIGEQPVTVMRVVNALGTYFIDENIKTRETQAVGTSGFLEEELVTIRNRLEQLEENLKKYREHFMGALPEQLETNLRILESLQSQINTKQQAFLDAKNRLAVLESQLAAESKSREDNRQEVQGKQEEVRVDSSKLDAMNTRLADLKSKYTDRHPDVIRMEKEVADFQLNMKTATRPVPVEIKPVKAPNQANLFFARQRETQIRLLNENKIEIAGLTEETRRLTAQMKIYQKRVEDTPKREQELMSLKRDYQNVKATYDSLLSRKLEAQIAVNMEKKQKGEQFRILDPARIPKKPVKPDMKKIFLIALAAGLGIGGGLIFMREYYDSSFKKIEDIETYLEIPVLSAVPALNRPENARWRRVNLIASSIFTLISIILFAGLSFITINGIDQALELTNRVISLRGTP